MVKVKVCCIADLVEAEKAIEAGAYALGLVGPMPSGPGVISDDMIASIAAEVRGRAQTFLLTSEVSAPAIIAHYRKVLTTTIQLVDSVREEDLRQVRQELPEVRIVQVVHVVDERSVDNALGLVPFVDSLLLDSGNPTLAVKELGGTGRVHDWSLSRRIVLEADVPVFLAGGLDPSNIQEAVRTVEPYGVDLCSGIRTGGKLDQVKLDSFFTNLQNAE